MLYEFKVKIRDFEGPLELLLTFIEKRKLHISDISLAKVADDFIVFTQSQENFSMGNSAHFILIASTLLLIKSKSLLPNLDLTIEEEESITDLEDRLKMYKRVKELSCHIQKMKGTSKIFFPEKERGISPVFAPSKEITIQSVKLTVKNLIHSLPKVVEIPKIMVKKIINLEEVIEKLAIRVKRSIKTSFKEFSTSHKGDKTAIIVSFLAMLELIKRGVVSATQEKHLEDISIETKEVNIPSYE